MENGDATVFVVYAVAVAIFASGWLFGQGVPSRRMRELFKKRRPPLSAEGGGVDFVVEDVKYTVSEARERSHVEMVASIYDYENDYAQRIHRFYLSLEANTPGPVANELHRIHNAGAMICSIRAASRGAAPHNEDSPAIRVEAGKDQP